MTELATDAQLLEQLSALDSRWGESYNPDTPRHIGEMVRIVELLADRKRLDASAREAMARALAIVEYMVGATNRHQRVDSFTRWCDTLASGPDAVPKWRERMQALQQDLVGRLAIYYPGRA